MAAVAVVVPGLGWWGVVAGVALVGVGFVVPARVAEWDVVVAASGRDVVHCEQFVDPEQRRRARRWCEHFLAVSEAVSAREPAGAAGQSAGAAREPGEAAREPGGAAREPNGAAREPGGPGGAARVGAVEVLLWRALVALRESLGVREALARVENRAGLAAEIAESTRALADLDRRLDEFADALRIAHEERDDPVSAERAVRRLAALDPIRTDWPVHPSQAV
ncbi:hypothetical protein [Saccharothrix variisporea]|uniref:hypothetical protein n=1 Tax=Saccharothrix variisporea TaxID=543527 RepID=UPI001476F1E2|nr:hypothetical protein [Saccharothrix variisporea]